MATAAEMCDADHWVRQVVSPVLFSAALEVALGRQRRQSRWCWRWVPNPVLTRMAQTWSKPQQPLVWLASLDRQAGVEDATAVARASQELGAD